MEMGLYICGAFRLISMGELGINYASVSQQ